MYKEVIGMKTSARNKLEGTIDDVDLGAVMAKIEIKVESPGLITAMITKESAEELGLKKGDKVVAIIKSTDVMVGK